MHKLSNIRFNVDKRDYAHLQIKRMLAAEYDYDTLRIFSSGTDAIVQKCPSVDISELRVFHKRKTQYCMELLTSCQRSDVSAQLKLAINAPKDGRGISQKQVLEQNLSSTDVYGRTSVERYTDVRFWQCDNADARIFAKEEVINIVNSRI